MISKLKFSFLAVIMLVLLGFGFQDQARGQIGLNGLFCPAVPDSTGWLETLVVGPGATSAYPDFTGGLIGTVEAIPNGVDLVGGLDWQHQDDFYYGPTQNPTNETGSQLVSWWTQKDGRNTYLQVTNADDSSINVHVVIFNENCIEIRNFCDSYTPSDTHQYDFGNLVTNIGQPVTIPSGNEGFVVVTAVENCDTSDEVAQDHDYLAGQTVIVDTTGDYSYGINAFARQSVCFDETVDVNRVFNGSYQFGADGWFVRQNVARVIDPLLEITPFQIPPFNPYFSELAAFVISSDQGGGSNSTYTGGQYNNLNDTDLVNVGGTDRQVAVWESSSFNVLPGDSSTLSYNLQFYTGEDFIATCGNYAAVRLIQNNGDGTGTVRDSRCYQQTGTVAPGAINRTNVGTPRSCALLADSDDDIAYDVYEFDGRTGFQIEETLTTTGATGLFTIQVITGLNNANNDACIIQDIIFDQDTAALVNNFELIGQEDVSCDGDLTGDFNARLDWINPDFLAGQFNVLPGNVGAGSDVVLINFADTYEPYRPIAAYSVVDISTFDEHENPLSCGLNEYCFVRLGLNDTLVNSDDFVPPTLAPTSAPPTVTPPPTLPPTPTPKPTNNGGSSSCAIAGNPVQLGTALANVLIPLVPVAFAFGVRAVRRRKK